jgi:peptidoglycan hydrolase CwlO-like protein|tara:strand:+ start:1371 stop:1721 length:351 start_codon:yes stop_codon:yes gene_type:complete
MDLDNKVKILQNNIRDLQSQLASAHIRIAELLKDKASTTEEVAQEKQFIQELTGEIAAVNATATAAIQAEMEAVPQVLDSRPSRPKLAKNEKWTTIDKEGNVQFLNEDTSKGILED